MSETESYNIPAGYYYTREHEWVSVSGKIATTGITDYAQKKLREIIYVELPHINTRIQQRQVIATVESVKASSDIYAPVSGKIVEVNTKLIDSPEIINESPYEDGWIAKIELTSPEELENLMVPDEYARYIEALEEEAGEEE